MTAPPDDPTIRSSMRLTNRMLLCRAQLLVLIVGAFAFMDVACGGSNGAGGASGTGGGTGGSSRGGTGGTDTAGAGGTSSAGTGGTSTGGTGGTSSGTGGTNAGGSGGGSCTANMSTDPMNCGACGHVCKNAASSFQGLCPTSGCCSGGSCGPSYSPCLTQVDVTNCNDYCASIGESCSVGCALAPDSWVGWGGSGCAVFQNPPDFLGSTSCSSQSNIRFINGLTQVRCCCTDTH